MSIAVGGANTTPFHGASNMTPISVALQFSAIEDAIWPLHGFYRSRQRRFLTIRGQTERELAGCYLHEHRDRVFVSLARIFEVVQRTQRLHAVHRDVGCETVEDGGRVSLRKREASFDVSVDFFGSVGP